MDQILKPIGDSLSSFFESDIVQFGLRAIGIYLVILWLATAYWAFRDMQQRSDNAILPYLAAAFIILFTPLFFVFAFWFYKIVRPHEKIGEVWERNLAEEALLAEVESIHHCPGCDRRIDDEWIICPSCRTRLKRVCPNCSRLVGMDWSLCAWCGKDFERREVPAAAMTALPPAREATGRIDAPAAAAGATGAVPAARSTRRSASSPDATDTTTSLPSSVRSSGPVRPATGPLPTTPQDPLPER
jgi:RNA polymerase subunit RPABC4/transcription elongation factor Spt4